MQLSTDLLLQLLIRPPAPDVLQFGVQCSLDGGDNSVAYHGEELESMARAAGGDEEVLVSGMVGY